MSIEEEIFMKCKYVTPEMEALYFGDDEIHGLFTSASMPADFKDGPSLDFNDFN